jgi:hypothetical protein
LAYFRDPAHDAYFIGSNPIDPVERLETARWVNYCGWYEDAWDLLTSVAKEVGDSEVDDTEVDDTQPSYEETRFG